MWRIREGNGDWKGMVIGWMNGDGWGREGGVRKVRRRKKEVPHIFFEFPPQLSSPTVEFPLAPCSSQKVNPLKALALGSCQTMPASWVITGRLGIKTPVQLLEL